MTIPGIILVSGEHDTGKTIFALGRTHPSRTAYIYDDVKPPPLQPGDFGFYHDLTTGDISSLKLFQFREYCLNLIEGLPEGLEGIIWDTWTRAGTALRNWAVANSQHFREREAFVMRHDPKVLGAQAWQEAHRYESSIIARLKEKAPNITLVAHTKSDFTTGAPVADVGKTLDTICSMRLWLRHNEDSAVPVALVLKRVVASQITENGTKFINILPRRIKPLPDEESLWDSIKRYQDNPMGNRHPTDDESPTPHELSILDGTLTDDQKEVWRAKQRQQEEADELEQLAKDSEVREFVQQQKQAGKNVPEVMVMVQNKYPEYADRVVEFWNGE